MPCKLLHVAVLVPEAWDQALLEAPRWGDLLPTAAPIDPKKQVAALEGNSSQWWSKPLWRYLPQPLAVWRTEVTRLQNLRRKIMWDQNMDLILFFFVGFLVFFRSIDFHIISGWRWIFRLAPLEKPQITHPKKLNNSVTEKNLGSTQEYFKVR